MNTQAQPDGRSRLSRNAFLALATQALPLVVGIISMPLLVRYLGPERVGLLSMIWILVSYFSVLDIGISSAVTRSVSIALATGGDALQLRAAFWSAASLQAAMGVLGSFAILLAAPPLVSGVLRVPPSMRGEALSALRMCFAVLPVVLVSGSVTGLLQAAQRFDTLARIQLPCSTAQYALPPLLAVAGTGLPAIVAAIVAVRVVSLAAMLWSASSQFPGLLHPIRIRREEVRSLLVFGTWAAVSSIVSPVAVYADRFLIANRLSLADVAYYSVPLDAAMRLLLFSSALATVLFPALSKMTATGRLSEANAVVRASVRYMICSTGLPCVLIALFAHEFLRIWLGAGFASHSTAALRLLLVGVFANSIARIPYALLWSLGSPRIPALLQVVGLPVQIAAALFLMARFGISGAASAWSGRLLLETFALFYFARRRSQLSLKHTLAESRGILATLAFLLIVGAASQRWTSPAISMRLLSAVVLGAVGVTLVWRFALTSRDRLMLRVGLLGRRAGGP